MTLDPTPSAAPQRRASRGYWVPGFIAMTALLTMALLLGAGDLIHGSPRSLSGPEMDSQIALGLQAKMDYRSAPTVTCPSEEPVRAGLSFTCSARHAGQTQLVDVVEEGQHGELQFFPAGT